MLSVEERVNQVLSLLCNTFELLRYVVRLYLLCCRNKVTVLF